MQLTRKQNLDCEKAYGLNSNHLASVPVFKVFNRSSQQRKPSQVLAVPRSVSACHGKLF